MWMNYRQTGGFLLALIAILFIGSSCSSSSDQATQVQATTVTGVPSPVMSPAPFAAVSPPAATAALTPQGSVPAAATVVVTAVAPAPTGSTSGPVEILTPVPQGNNLVVYDNPSYPFLIALPKEWSVNEAMGEERGITALSPADGEHPRGALTIAYSEGSTLPTLDARLALIIQQLRNDSGTSEFKTEAEHPLRANQFDGMRQCFTYKRQNTPLRQCTVILHSPARIYEIDLLSPQDVFSMYEPVLNEVIPTLKER